MPTVKHIARRRAACPTLLDSARGPIILIRTATGVVAVLDTDLRYALPGTFRAAPRDARLNDGRTLLAGASTDGRTVISVCGAGEAPSSAPDAWIDLGGQTTDVPAVASGPSGGAFVVVRGLDGAAWVRTLEASSPFLEGATDWGESLDVSAARWSPWSSLGGQFQGEPAAAQLVDGRRVVAAVASDGSVWACVQTNGAWGGWTSLQGVVTSSLSLLARSDGDVVVAGRGGDGAVWVRTLAQPWRSLAGATIVLPSAPDEAARPLLAPTR